MSLVGNTGMVDQWIYMDACDYGLCVVNHTVKQYFIYEFPKDMVARIKVDVKWCTINVREYLSVLVAAMLWADLWYGKIIGHRIDNTSAVAWTKSLETKEDSKASQIATLILDIEIKYKFFNLAKHIAGHDNVLADLGSRAKNNNNKAKTFNSMVNNMGYKGLVHEGVGNILCDLISTWLRMK